MADKPKTEKTEPKPDPKEGADAIDNRMLDTGASPEKRGPVHHAETGFIRK